MDIYPLNAMFIIDIYPRGDIMQYEEDIVNNRLRILDLWSGSGSATEIWKRCGHEVITVDIDPKNNPTICKDIIDVTYEELQEYGYFDFIWASPDCRIFSIANLHSRHFVYEDGILKVNTDEATEMIMRVRHTLDLIYNLSPTWWILENPRGMLRKMPFMNKYIRKTITYCQYGDFRMKPTDLWGDFPLHWNPRPMCKNGDPCHESSPRGEHTTTKNVKVKDRQKVPIELTHDIMFAIGQDIKTVVAAAEYYMEGGYYDEI